MPDTKPRHVPRRAGLSAVFACLLLCAVLFGEAFAADVESIGHVSRVQGLSFAVRGDSLRALERNSLIGRDDLLKTGPGSRLEIVLLDETRLSLGADTVFGVERYGLGRKGGSVLLRLDKGACRLVTGNAEAEREGGFELATPLGRVEVRGGDFWAGASAEGELAVLLVSGKGVEVVTDGGRARIARPMEGLSLNSRAVPPPAPSMWSPDRRERALHSVSFGR